MVSIAVDFDGTLVQDEFPKIGKIRQPVVDLVRQLQFLGVKTILWTCRCGNVLDEAVQWCEKQGLKFDAVNCNLPEVQEKWGGDTRKVMADIYLDDKNLGGFSLLHLANLVNSIQMEKSGV